MTPDEVRARLADAGVLVGHESVEVERRDGRWLARLPGERLAWFPMDADGAQRLELERRVLRLVEAHCGFAAPRVLLEGDGGWDLRTLVPSAWEPFAAFHRADADADFARRLGSSLGAILAELHRIPVSSGWLPGRPSWPEPDILAHLPEVVTDAELLARAQGALARWSALLPPGDPVLVHGDVGLHNVAFAADGTACGLFDYDGAALGDRCEDFKYLILSGGDGTMLDAAIAVYEPATGARIDRERVRLLNAAAAIGFLAFRHGHAPDEDWCGRTLAEDLAWTRSALAAAGL